MNQVARLFVLLMLLGLVACTGPQPVRKSNNGPDLDAAAKINVKLAVGYMQRGNLEVAREKLEKALEQDDEYIPAYTTMALLMDMTGDPEKANDYYHDALNIDPKNPELLNNYGAFLCKHNMVDDAVEQFNKVLKNQFYETPEKSHSNMGYCLLQAKSPNYALAEIHLREALKYKSDMPSALLAMGELAIKTKRYLMARAYMQRFHAVAAPTANSLWYQLLAEKKLGDEKYFLKLSRELLKRFPESPQAKQLMKYSER